MVDNNTQPLGQETDNIIESLYSNSSQRLQRQCGRDDRREKRAKN